MPKIRNIIIFIVIAIAFVLIYVFFIKPSPEQASLVSSGADGTLPNIDGSTASTTNANSLITKDFLVLFSNITNIKLDDAILSDPAFNNLHDSSIVLIPDGTEGRPNPFAQFGNDLPVAPVPSVPVPSVPVPNLPAVETIPSGTSSSVPTPPATSGTGKATPAAGNPTPPATSGTSTPKL